MKKQSPIVQKAEAYVFSLIRDKLPPNYIYHNYNHTVDVVESVIEIAEGSELSKEETEMVVLAAWFHDTGFIEVYDGHEEEAPANYVPAAAVIRRVRALIGITGRKACAGGLVSQM